MGVSQYPTRKSRHDSSLIVIGVRFALPFGLLETELETDRTKCHPTALFGFSHDTLGCTIHLYYVPIRQQQGCNLEHSKPRPKLLRRRGNAQTFPSMPFLSPLCAYRITLCLPSKCQAGGQTGVGNLW
jgi:hypothetical protein